MVRIDQGYHGIVIQWNLYDRMLQMGEAGQVLYNHATCIYTMGVKQIGGVDLHLLANHSLDGRL